MKIEHAAPDCPAAVVVDVLEVQLGDGVDLRAGGVDDGPAGQRQQAREWGNKFS